MENEPGFSPKLWLENRDVNVSAERAPAEKRVVFNKKSLAALQKQLRVNHLTWEKLIHAAFGILLCRFSTSDYLVYGSGIAGKGKYTKLSLASSIKPIKFEVNEETTTKKCLHQISSQLGKKPPSKKAITPEDCRYLLLIRSAKPSSDMLNLSRFPLVLHTNKMKPTETSIVYNTAFFNKQAIDNLASHLVHFITVMLNGLKNKVIELPLLTPSEQKKILGHWQSPTYPFSIPTLDCCTHDLFAIQAEKNPTKTAVTQNGHDISYQELHYSSTMLAYQLIKKGIKTGDRVCVLMDRTPAWIMTIMAVFKTGATYVPINPKFPDERLEYVFGDSDPALIITDHDSQIPEAYKKRSITIRDIKHYSTNNNTNLEKHQITLPNVSLDDIAYIMYTSGTTGKPKGVLIRHRSLVNLTAWYMAAFKIKSNDRASQFGSQGFDAHLCEIVPFLSVGASIHIVDDNTKLTPSLFFEWLKREEITVCDLTTAYAQMLFPLTWPQKIKLRLMKIGGETLSRFPTHRLPFDIWNCYGPTETTVEATYYKLNNVNKFGAPPIGKPICRSSVYIVDKYLQPVPIGIAGEILICGDCVSPGYLNQPELTKARFIANPFMPDSKEKLYCTGDLARWTEDGEIDFIGRIDNQVKIRGYRIDLDGIENVLAKHTDVNECIVIANENINKEKSLIAYVVPDLNKQRFLYQERCLFSFNNHQYFEALTDDISKGGIALSGITQPIKIGSSVRINVKLPGMTSSMIIGARIIWQHNSRCGFVFDVNDEQQNIISKSIDYHLSTHNVLELILSASAKRSLKQALKNELPEYMVPSIFVTLMNFPLTFSGKIDVKALPPPQEFEQLLQKDFVAPKTETEKKLTTIWKKLLNKEKISMTDNFFDLGGSSLTAAELSVNIMQQFKTTIPAKLLFDLSYIPILAEFIDTNGKKYNNQSVIQEEIERDARLPEHITPLKKLQADNTNPKHILLTGAGGFLGIYFLRQLLKDTNAKIYCLIRSNEFDTPAKRLLDTIQKFDLGNDITLNDRRIVTIRSDLSLDNFGLPPDQYLSLAEKVDLIFHCGAQVNIMASYNKLRGSNVLGTMGIIKFATTYVDKPIHYISTLSSAYRKDANGELTEVFPDNRYEDLFGGYAISKWVSERLLSEAKNRGLPVSIYRCGYITGETGKGVCNLNDALFMLMKGCIQLGFAPMMQEKITVLPVDFVSHAITNMSLAKPNGMNVYHIDHPTGIMWSDLVAWINDFGYDVKLIPIKQWQEKLVTIRQDNALFPFLPYYLAIPENPGSPDVSITRATKLLNSLNITYPDINDALLTIYFDYMQQMGFLPATNKRKITSNQTSKS